MNERQAVDEIMADEKIWSNGSVMAYHVTPMENLFGIQRKGIDPSCSKGKMRASWYVSKKGVLWAIAHCSNRHSIPVDQLVVCVAMLPRNAIKRSAFPQMFYVLDRYEAENISPAIHFVSAGEGENE